MIELSPRLIGSSTDPAGSQGALGHSFGAAGSAMKNAKNPSSQRPSATDSAPCRLTNPTFPWARRFASVAANLHKVHCDK